MKSYNRLHIGLLYSRPQGNFTPPATLIDGPLL